MYRRQSKSSQNTMEFCYICQNMLYMRTDPKEGHLIKFCKNCKFNHTMDAKDPKRKPYKITHTLYSDDDLLYLQHQNKYLRYDPTLPRICDPTISCPNSECNGKDNPRVLYIKYHPIDLKYLYCCDHCGQCGTFEEFNLKKK